MRFAVDTWDPEYGVAADATQLEPSAGDVDVTVECSAENWAPIAPDGAAPPESMVFIDGVRRFDARVWISGEGGGSVRPGVCASVAAGVVRCQGDRAEVVAVEIRRGVFVSADGAAGPIVTRHATYELYPVAEDSNEGLYLGVHEQMTALEATLTDDDVELAVFDGPLRGRQHSNCVGYIKTQQVQYLPDEQQATTYALARGERTPVFLVNAGGFTRWSWYVRLPGPVAHPLSGIIRCELPGAGTAADAATRAGQVTATLPRFASEPHKDSRAPQNLYPIAGLERDLRRRLGDQQLLERALRVAAAAA